ncbi:MAG: hypothetical protein ACI9KE_005737 [Polyangiales bacterium]|jgi:hypothetical protein
MDAANLDADTGFSEDSASPRGPNPRFPAADFDVVLPYLGPPATIRRTVGARSNKLDVHFNFDTTGSFSEEIEALQSDLAGRIVPAVEDRVDDVAFGVSHFEDFPVEPYGVSGDEVFEVLTPITSSRSRLASAVAALRNLGSGGDGPEAGFESLYQVATGDGYRHRGVTYIPESNEGIGGVEFREDALRVVLHATDAPSHEGTDYLPALEGVRGQAEAIAALQERDIRVIGIVTTPQARADLTPLVRASGAVVRSEGGVCRTGLSGAERTADADGSCPLVFDVGEDGAGLSDAVVSSIVDLLNGVAYGEVYGRAREDSFAFVRTVLALSSRADGAEPELADLRPVDGLDDTFLDVRFGTELVFEAVLENLTLPGADYDQVLRLEIDIIGDSQLLDSFSVRVTVPAMDRRDAGTDAGSDAGNMDAGNLDGGNSDTGAEDAGADVGEGTDAGVADAGAADVALPDAGPDAG